MVTKRIITGLTIAIAAVVIIWLGDPWFTVTVCIAAVLATLEFYRIVKNEQIQPLTGPGIIFSILLIANAYAYQFHLACPAFPPGFSVTLLFTLITLIPLIWMLFRTNKENSFVNWGWTVAGILYIGWLMSFYILIRSMENGIGWTFLVIFCTALCDIFAYAVGSMLGKHPLASSVSPEKTVEGSIGGLTASIIFAVTASVIFNLPLSPWQMIVAGIIIGIFAQSGDLVESLLKRNMKAKDAGHLLPGHGGMLDRIDSHLLIAPIAYYLILLVNN